jgi:hypothetical protein
VFLVGWWVRFLESISGNGVVSLIFFFVQKTRIGIESVFALELYIYNSRSLDPKRNQAVLCVKSAILVVILHNPTIFPLHLFCCRPCKLIIQHGECGIVDFVFDPFHANFFSRKTITSTSTEGDLASVSTMTSERMFGTSQNLTPFRRKKQARAVHARSAFAQVCLQLHFRCCSCISETDFQLNSESTRFESQTVPPETSCRKDSNEKEVMSLSSLQLTNSGSICIKRKIPSTLTISPCLEVEEFGLVNR